MSELLTIIQLKFINANTCDTCKIIKKKKRKEKYSFTLKFTNTKTCKVI